jgi:hypothetical protein
VDNLRTGASDRSYTLTSGSIWPNNTEIVLRQEDFNTYFTGGENTVEAGTKLEGLFIRVEGNPLGLPNGLSYLRFQVRLSYV